MNNQQRQELVHTAHRIGGGLAELVDALIALRPPEPDSTTDTMDFSLLTDGWWTCHDTVLGAVARVIAQETPAQPIQRTHVQVTNVSHGDTPGSVQTGIVHGGLHFH